MLDRINFAQRANHRRPGKHLFDGIFRHENRPAHFFPLVFSASMVIEYVDRSWLASPDRSSQSCVNRDFRAQSWSGNRTIAADWATMGCPFLVDRAGQYFRWFARYNKKRACVMLIRSF